MGVCACTRRASARPQRRRIQGNASWVKSHCSSQIFCTTRSSDGPQGRTSARIVIPMRVGMIGTGAISHKHAQAYKNIGFELTVCTDIFEAAGRKFAEQYGAEFVPTYEEVCRHPRVDFVDVCTFPDFRLEPVELCAQNGKHVLVQKPMATNLDTARKMIETARKAGIQLSVVSQHRF